MAEIDPVASITAQPTPDLRVAEGPDGLVRLSIHHVGLGWLSFGLSMDQARQLAHELEARAGPTDATK